MAAERTRHSGARQGYALFAIVIGLVVITVLSVVVLAPLSGDNKQERIQRAADVLHRFVAEIDSASGNNINYFRGHVTLAGGPGAARQKWPGRLSQLYTPIVGADLWCGGTSYTAIGLAVANWRGPYHLVPIRTTGHNIAPGFFANDALVKVSTSEAYIQIPSVALDDAKALDLTVDLALNAGAGKVQYNPPAANPTTVEYHFTNATLTPC